MLDLCCCVHAFSSCNKRELLSSYGAQASCFRRGANFTMLDLGEYRLGLAVIAPCYQLLERMLLISDAKRIYNPLGYLTKQIDSFKTYRVMSLRAEPRDSISCRSEIKVLEIVDKVLPDLFLLCLSDLTYCSPCSFFPSQGMFEECLIS